MLVAGAACGDPASSSDDAGPSIMQPERLDVRIAVEGADENGRLPDLECHAPLRVRFSISNLEYDEVRVRWSDLHPSTRPFAESSSSAAIDDPDDCGTVTRRPVSVAPERIRSIAPGEYEVEVDLEFERPISACTTIAECRLPSGVAALGCVGGWRSLEISAWNGGERVSWREVTSLARCDRLVVERTDPIASSRCNGVYGAQLMSDGTAVALVALPARLLTIGPTGARTGDRTLTPITTSTGDTLSSPEWFARGPDDTFWLAGEFWRDTTTCTTDAQCGPGALCDDGKGTGGSCNYGHLAVRVHPSAPTTPLEQRYLGLRVTTDVDRTRLEQDQLEIRHLARSDRLLAIGAPPEDPGVPATYEVHEMRATGSMLLPEFDGAWLVDELPESDVVALYPDRFEVRSDGGDILASVALPHADDHAAAALRLRGGQVGRLGDGRIVAAVVIGDPASVVPPSP
ncbi:MAG: hypothetical protein M5U28_39805 [Sandaracinaceae bacterium]|nr:hypothetical protein [Sandaracinaceae bacterium]